MKPITPISLKIRPEIRQRLKSAAYQIEWSEHQFAKNVLEAALDLVDRKDSAALDRIVHLSRAASKFDSSTA